MACAQGVAGTTVHNFPLGGVVGSSRGACSYCHVTHGKMGGAPAQWDPALTGKVYKVYESTTLQAQVGQPTGSTKMCLSCHDGTLAPEAVGPGGTILPATIREMLQGNLDLGTHMSDDHPDSFPYDSGISADDPQIKHPSTFASTKIKLDKNGQMQCTTCHDPHLDNIEGFLVMENRRSALCLSCHQPTGWGSSVHATSTATSRTGQIPWHTQWLNVADNGCENCHAPHHAGSHARLLIHQDEEENCLACHDGSVAEKNVEAEMAKPSAHRPGLYRAVHDPNENPTSAPIHVECHDCHNPHAVRAEAGGDLPASIEAVSGVNAAGTAVAAASREYEICFKCHGDNADRPPARISRHIVQTNTRLEFDSANASFHPLIQTGINRDVPSLKEPLTEDSIVKCTDCHASDSDTIRGPHGSAFSPILVRNYTTADFTSESASAYALCYGCHDRDSILDDQSFEKHKKHIVDKKTPCSVCHDPHGISYTQGNKNNHTHLINFDTSVVGPSKKTGRLEFEDTGDREGRCHLMCHGDDHHPEEYKGDD